MKVTAKLQRIEGETRFRLVSPRIGLWRESPTEGSLVQPGTPLGRIEVLGVLHPVVAPAGAQGVVVTTGGDKSRAARPTGYGELLVELDPEAVMGAEAVAAEVGKEAGGLVYRASSGGRFYRKASPDKPAFVSEGDVITKGQPVGLVEVMKTFHRIGYEGDGLPERAKVLRFVVEDGADLMSGDPIFELEPA